MATGSRWLDGSSQLFNRSGRWQGAHSLIRHMRYWTPPAFSGDTVINMRFSHIMNLPANANFRVGANNGMARWNAVTSQTRVRFEVNNTSANIVDLRASNATIPTALGSYDSRPSNPGWGPGVTGFNIHLYEVPIVAYRIPAGYTVVDVITNVMIHELAHTVGLNEGGSGLSGPGNPILFGLTCNGSVMNACANLNRRIFPTDFDIQSVRMIYN